MADKLKEARLREARASAALRRGPMRASRSFRCVPRRRPFLGAPPDRYRSSSSTLDLEIAW